MKNRVTSLLSTLMQKLTCLLLCCVFISLTVMPSSALADGLKCQNGLDGGCQELTEVVGDGVLLAQAPIFALVSKYTGECMTYAAIGGYAWMEPCNGMPPKIWEQLPTGQMMAYDGQCLVYTNESYLDAVPCDEAYPWFFQGDTISLIAPQSNLCLTAKIDEPGYAVNDCNGQPSSRWDRIF